MFTLASTDTPMPKDFIEKEICLQDVPLVRGRIGMPVAEPKQLWFSVQTPMLALSLSLMSPDCSLMTCREHLLLSRVFNKKKSVGPNVYRIK